MVVFYHGKTRSTSAVIAGIDNMSIAIFENSGCFARWELPDQRCLGELVPILIVGLVDIFLTCPSRDFHRWLSVLPAIEDACCLDVLLGSSTSRRPVWDRYSLF